MKRLLILGLLVLASCRKPEPSLEGKWFIDLEHKPVELELRSDKSLTVGDKSGTWSKTEDSRLIMEMKGTKAEIYEYTVTEQFLYLTTERETLRFRRGGAGEADQRNAERKKVEQKKTLCCNNLSQLWKMQHNYMVQYGGSSRSMPVQLGGDFWLHLTRLTPPLIDSTLRGIFQCPFRVEEDRVGVVYRGPAKNVHALADGDPVGACIGNHPDGTCVILRKSGDVQVVTNTDPLFQKAMQTTKE